MMDNSIKQSFAPGIVCIADDEDVDGDGDDDDDVDVDDYSGKDKILPKA